MKLWSSVRAVLVALTVVCLGFAIGAPARADGADGVTLLHGIPGVTVDVVVDGKVVFGNFAPGQTQDLSSFAGTTLKQVEVRPAGTTTAVIGPADVPVPAKGNWTLVAHLDAAGKPKLSALQNNVAATKAGQGRLSVVHAAAAPAVDLVVGTDRPITNLSNGDGRTLDLDATTVSGAKLALTGKEPAIDVPTVEVKAGVSTIVYAVGSLADNTLTFYTQTINVGENAPSSSPTASPTASPSGSSTPSTSASPSSSATPTPIPSLTPVKGGILPVGSVTLLHGVPGVPVDVLINGQVVTANFQPNTTLNLGAYRGKTIPQLEVRLAGTKTTILGPGDVTIPKSELFRTLLVHLDANGKPLLSSVAPSLKQSDISTSGTLIVAHAAAAPAVDLVVGSKRPITDLKNSEYVTLTGLKSSITGAKLAPTGKDPIATLPTVQIAPGIVTVVYAVGSLSKGTLTYYTQSVQVGQVGPNTASPSNKLPPTGLSIPDSGNGLWGWAVLLTFATVITVAASRRRDGAHR